MVTSSPIRVPAMIVHAGVDHRAAADLHVVADGGQGMNVHVRADGGRGTDDRRGRNAYPPPRSGRTEPRDDLRKGLVDVFHLDHRQSDGQIASGGYHGRRRTTCQSLDPLGAVDQRDFPGPGVGQRRGPHDRQAAIANQATID